MSVVETVAADVAGAVLDEVELRRGSVMGYGLLVDPYPITIYRSRIALIMSSSRSKRKPSFSQTAFIARFSGSR